MKFHKMEMGRFIQKRLELFFMFSTVVAPTNCTKVEFFEGTNYQGAKYEATSTPSCVNLPSYFSRTFSIKTDGCIVVFTDKNCKSDAIRVKPGPENSQGYSSAVIVYRFFVKSFKNCNALEADHKINVDIYSQRGYKGDLIKIRDLCTCQNLPISIRDKHISSWNYGNCYLLYEKTDCDSRRHHVVAIREPFMGQWSINDETHSSIQPCLSNLPQHCLGLSAVIYSIEPLQDFSIDPSSIKAFAMSGSGSFRNAGPNTMTERYSAELEVSETKQFEFSQSLRTLTSITFEAGFKMTTKGGLPGIAEVEVEQDIRTSLSTELESSRTETEMNSIQKTKRFSVAKDIEIGPCTEQEVVSFVEVASDVEINYRVLFKVTGSIQNRTRMNATEVKKRLTEFTYVRDEDEYTVIAETTAKFKTTYSRQTRIAQGGEYLAAISI